MLDKILETARQSQFDFRSWANPQDPLRHLFADWVPYYRMKWAIASVLQPQSILEIGVRYGYSARAFLEAAPRARFVGIDLDSDRFGGVNGAIDWARGSLRDYDCELIVADSQGMDQFPGSQYDLIHVDGQQDGDGSFRDLELALNQGRYVLVDGYHWTQTNYLAVNDFLFQNRDRLDWYAAIPGYAGELLIKVAASQAVVAGSNSHSLQSTYTQAYYTQDCGGYEAFLQHQGRRLEDPRLRSVAAIATIVPRGRVLDLGCGRGELAYFLAQMGYEVTAVDYSEDAITLAQSVFATAPEAIRQRVTFCCVSVVTATFASNHYDLAIASDLIEHLAPDEVEQLYHNVHRWLKPTGRFVLHTFPNLWHYRYDYARRRRTAAKLGAWLPLDPRTRYERLMHINEQSPAVLKRQLSQAFSHVSQWFGDVGNPGGSLVQPYSRRELAAAPSLYAVASSSPIDRPQLQTRLWMKPVRFWWRKLKLDLLETPAIAAPDQTFEIQAQLTNYSRHTLSSYGPNPIHFSYRWLDPDSRQTIVAEGQRTALFPPLPGHPIRQTPDKLGYATMRCSVQVQAPSQSGRALLRITLVQEGVQWLDRRAHLFAECVIKVV
jgi:2-polyprenyl-3-methyl-5-hydroxy-6-metoxy-1,4-benzoquinol methylase